jgi:cystathionine gamma-lyase
VYRRLVFDFSYVDPVAGAAAVEAAIRPSTKLVWIETPTNPMLKLCDIAAVAEVCQRKGVLLAVDNTFMTPFLQRPLELGADIVCHSMTKYLNGHSDVVGGCLIVKDDELRQRIGFLQNAVGSVPSPMDSVLVMRGTKTLHVRMERHCANALAIARHLERHQQVERVHYPGLESHPQNELGRRQMAAGGGMVAFELRGDLQSANTLASSTRIFTLAESLGGVESLIEIPSSMTHASIPAADRRAAGLADGLVRLSVGIEDAEDLIEDLDQALARARS